MEYSLLSSCLAEREYYSSNQLKVLKFSVLSHKCLMKGHMCMGVFWALQVLQLSYVLHWGVNDMHAAAILNFWGNMVFRGNFQAGSDMSHLPSNTARAIAHFLRAIRCSCWSSSFLPAVQIFINQLDSLFLHLLLLSVCVHMVTPSFPDWLDMVVVTQWLIKEYWVLFPQDEMGQEK